MFRIIVDCLPPSLNRFYSGMHWAKRKAIVDEWHGLMRLAFVETQLPKTLPTPITLSVTQFCKGIVRDSDNAVVGAKFCGDALKLYGYIPDDSPEFISTVILQSAKGKADKTVFIIQ